MGFLKCLESTAHVHSAPKEECTTTSYLGRVSDKQEYWIGLKHKASDIFLKSYFIDGLLPPHSLVSPSGSPRVSINSYRDKQFWGPAEGEGDRGLD